MGHSQPWKSCSQNNHPGQAKKAKSAHENLPLLSDSQDVNEDYTDTEASEGSDSLTNEDKDAIVFIHEEVQNHKM